MEVSAYRAMLKHYRPGGVEGEREPHPACLEKKQITMLFNAI